MLKSMLDSSDRRANFVFGDHQVSVWNLKKREEEEDSDCYSVAGEQPAPLLDVGGRPPPSLAAYARGHVAVHVAMLKQELDAQTPRPRP